MGFQEGLVLIFLLTVVFGASRIPQLGEAFGRSIRLFKRGLSGENEIDVTDRSQVGAGDEEGDDERPAS
jgi:sec-independent protein translocase protein TatA